MPISPAFSATLSRPNFAGATSYNVSQGYGLADRVKLASNENPMGCSPHVTLAVTAQLGELSRYPDETSQALKQGIANFYGLPASQIILGNGANELLNAILDTFVSANEVIVHSQYTFSQFQLNHKTINATTVEVPAKNFAHDLDKMAETVCTHANCRIVFIGNPNNPTGTVLTIDDIRDFIKSIPSNVLVVIDETYIEFAPNADALALLQSFDNLLLLRTFSKAYGLAALRIGYIIASPTLAQALNQARHAFNTNLIANVAAIAALNDQEFLAKYLAMNAEQKQVLYNGFDSLGLTFVPSATNFILVNVGDGIEVAQQLASHGVLVRAMQDYDLAAWIRVTIGVAEENSRFLDTLEHVLV